MRFSARNLLIVLVLFILFLTFTGAFFIVNETKQALVLQFGDPRKVVTKPGLQFKIPFIQDAVFLDSRLLNLDPQPEEMILSDQKRIIVDSFGLKVIDSSQHAIRSMPAEPVVWYLGISNSVPILLSRILYLSFIVEAIIIA